MQTYYTVLYIPVNTSLEERLSIGLIMSDGENHYFKYSQSKLQIIKALVSTKMHSMLKSYFKNLDNETNYRLNLNNEIFNDTFNNENGKWINMSYLKYLSKYSNNLIQYSEPKPIGIELNKENFNKLFEKFIYINEEVMPIVNNVTVYDKVKLNLYPKIESRVNIDTTLTVNEISNLFVPLEVNFIGMNDVPVAGQTFDFEKRHYNLENDITRFISLAKALELEGKKDGKYYILGKEPQVSHNEKNHMIWKQIYETKFLDFVDIDDVDEIEDYILQHNVKPFIIA
jgi:hypothetical protein